MAAASALMADDRLTDGHAPLPQRPGQLEGSPDERYDDEHRTSSHATQRGQEPVSRP